VDRRPLAGGAPAGGAVLLSGHPHLLRHRHRLRPVLQPHAPQHLQPHRGHLLDGGGEVLQLPGGDHPEPGGDAGGGGPA